MVYNEIINKIKPELDKIIEHYKGELAKLRTGRPSTSLVEDLKVECYGQTFPLKQLAIISLADARSILIQPWDKSILSAVEKAISFSNLNLNPIVDGEVVRVQLPPITEENRKNLIKILKERAEEARVTIRRWREKAWEEIQEGYKSGEIREDDKFRGKDELQELITKYNEKTGELSAKKEEEILTT